MSNVLNLNSAALNKPTLALIAEMLERGGSVVVTNCAIRPDAPMAKELGYEVFREERDGYWHTHVEYVKQPFAALEFWTPNEAVTHVSPKESNTE